MLTKIRVKSRREGGEGKINVVEASVLLLALHLLLLLLLCWLLADK